MRKSARFLVIIALPTLLLTSSCADDNVAKGILPLVGGGLAGGLLGSMLTKNGTNLQQQWGVGIGVGTGALLAGLLAKSFRE